MEARLLGVWESTESDADFVAKTPRSLPLAGTSAGKNDDRLVGQQVKDRDVREFEAYRRRSIDRPGPAGGNNAWHAFMRSAARQVAIAFKCGVPVFAHSGGGSVVTFLLRLFDASPKARAMIRGWTATWPSERVFRVVLLEGVSSEEMRRRFNDRPESAYYGRLDLKQYVARDGSDTFVNTIEAETRSIGATPLPRVRVRGAKPPETDRLRALISDIVTREGHAGLGLYVLAHGALPGQPSFLQR